MFKDRLNKVESLGIGLTSKCNLDCPHCYSKNLIKDTITLSEVKQLLKKFPQLKKVNFGTGESILNPDLNKIIDYFYQNQIKIGLTSNGLTIAEVISRETAPSDEFKSVVNNAIKTVLPSKKGVSDAWLRVYVSGEPKHNFCGMPLNSFLNNVWDLGLGDLNPNSQSKIFGFVNVPLISGDDFVFVVLCVHKEWFDE